VIGSAKGAIDNIHVQLWPPGYEVVTGTFGQVEELLKKIWVGPRPGRASDEPCAEREVVERRYMTVCVSIGTHLIMFGHVIELWKAHRHMAKFVPTSSGES
jgi:hypothetical protein